MNKRTLFAALCLLLLPASLIFAGGDKESSQDVEEKVVRVASQVPGLITPGSWDGQVFSLNSSIYEYLVEINPETGELDPVLATSWETSDGKSWIFTLREGVTFHDGSTFDAEDLKFTIERTQDPAVGHLKKNDFAIVESINIIDPYKVEIKLKESRPTFIYLMTDYNMMMLSSDYDYASKGESKPMGTGPFKMEQLIPKESALLVKNTEYWDPALPKLDKIIIYFVPDIEASISMLEADRVDIVPFVTPVIKNRLASNGDLSVIAPYQEHRFISLVQGMEPFDDNRVRLAFKYTMDPEVIAKSVAQMELNEGIFYNEVPVMNNQAEYLDLPLRERNIEKAKELLTQAGYPDGVTVDLYFASDHPFGKELAQTIKELSAPAGFNLELKGYTRDIYLSQYWLKAPMCITGWGARADISMLLNYAFRSDASWNESHINIPEVDVLIDKIRSEVDPDVRLGYYHELQKIFYDEGTIINVQVPYLVAVNNRVVNYRQPISMIPQYKYMDIK
ncbi:MAG: ABC transporter substrate-binding protein [Sphaerochaetaceae bacterium]